MISPATTSLTPGLGPAHEVIPDGVTGECFAVGNLVNFPITLRAQAVASEIAAQQQYASDCKHQANGPRLLSAKNTISVFVEPLNEPKRSNPPVVCEPRSEKNGSKSVGADGQSRSLQPENPLQRKPSKIKVNGKEYCARRPGHVRQIANLTLRDFGF
jgi:hypothetical protein